MQRYVLDDARAVELLGSYSLLQDLPLEVGQVRTKCTLALLS